MSDSSQTVRPKVSVLIPVYNERQHITAALESIAGQDYPAECIEIVVAHGTSTDGTGELLQSFCRDHPDVAVKILDNPSNNTAVGRNICLRHAAGPLVLNFSGHAVLDENLLSTLVKKIDRLPDHVAGIGCANRWPDTDFVMERAITVAMLSLFGGRGHVDSAFQAETDRVARSVAFTLYKRDVLETLGGFDEQFWCGQDAELNFRLSHNGYEVWFTPDTAVKHHKRSSLGGFMRQMYRYGVARAKLVRKFPKSFRLIFLLPLLFTIAVVAIGIWATFVPVVRVVVAVAAALFVVASIFSSARANGNLLSILLSPVIYSLLYVTYGVGFLRGLVLR